MTVTKTALVLTLWLGFASLASAQPERRPAAVLWDATVGEAKQTKLYEDIEILRRILNRKLGELYPSGSSGWYRTRLGGAGTGSSTVPMDANQSAASATYWLLEQASRTEPYYRTVAGASPAFDTEGIYLNGHGIVYSVTLPPPANPVKQEAAKPASKPLSEWERERKRLLGEKVEGGGEGGGGGGPAVKQPSISETILRLLAEQGRNLSQLDENETVTVAVTFRPLESGPAHASHPYGVVYPDMGTGTVSTVVTSTLGGAGGGATVAPPQEAPASPSTARDYLLLADLRSKQGKYDEAVRHYEKALQLAPQAAEGGVSERLLRQKLAQVLLEKGDVDGARKALEQLAALQQKQAQKAKAAETARKSPLPSKLIISVPKKLLDQVGAGKLSFEEFRKAATVQYLTFPAGAPTYGI